MADDVLQATPLRKISGASGTVRGAAASYPSSETRMARILFFSLYSFFLLVFCVFGTHRLWLLWLYFKHTRQPLSQPQSTPPPDTALLQAPNEKDSQPASVDFREQNTNPPPPIITVQLPIFNEKYVVERLVHAVCAIDYPLHLLEIQILDDSTDDTTAIVDQLVHEKKTLGFDIEVVRRVQRTGYKAGALQEGLERSKGELLFIFDADFLPPPHILQASLAHFHNPRVGMVQFPWSHINRDYSLLTYAQAVFLDGHFVIEHLARSRSGSFFNFNGTAGVWRKACIRSAGGWQGDTLTEDLDLSYRAQLKGWQFVYVPDVAVPSELPVELNAFKSQQYRWAKGGAQTAIKLLPQVLRSPLPLPIKIEAFFHLASNWVYLLMPCLLLLYPLQAICPDCIPLWLYGLSFVTALLSLVLFYGTAQFKACNHNLVLTVLSVPLIMGVGVGLCINNARAVLEAILAKKSAFLRTPKYNIVHKSTRWKRRNQYRISLDIYALIELLFFIYLAAMMAVSIRSTAYHLLPFMVIFMGGFLYFIILTLRQFYVK